MKKQLLVAAVFAATAAMQAQAGTLGDDNLTISGFGKTDFDAGYRLQCGGDGQRGIDGHMSVLVSGKWEPLL